MEAIESFVVCLFIFWNYGLTADSLQQNSIFEISRLFKQLYRANVIRFLSLGLKNSPLSCFCDRDSDSNLCIK
jgi:hypothetical protein